MSKEIFIVRNRITLQAAILEAAVLMIESLKMIKWLIVQCFSVSDLNMTKQGMLFDSPQRGF